MATEKVTEVIEKRRVGRPNVDREEKIESNGFSKRQWDWIKKEAKAKHIDAAQFQRMIADWFIDSVEASRSPSVATLQDDRKFETLINSKKRKSNKNTKQTRRSKK